MSGIFLESGRDVVGSSRVSLPPMSVYDSRETQPSGARVAVTGASGKLGRAVVRDLIASGRDVLALDQVRPDDHSLEFIAVDLADYAQVLEVLTGSVDEHRAPDAVVHLAAVPAPGLRSNSAT